MLCSLRNSRIRIALNEKLCEHNISYVEAEKIKEKYLQICDGENVSAKLQKFNRSIDRLDIHFLSTNLT